MNLLVDHVERFNQAVRSGDFEPTIAAFTDDGELHFEGIPVGPFVGRDAIAAAYREQPPDDQVELGRAEERDDGTIAARYRWLADDGREVGEVLLTPRDGRIAKLVVTLD